MPLRHNHRLILKKSKAPTKRKSAKPVKDVKVAKSPARPKSTPRVPVKMPVDTFDAWVAKQVKSERKTGSPEHTKSDAPQPKDTFDSWIDKQKPRENWQQKSNTSVPDTYDQWMDKQVAQKSADEKKEAQEVPPEASAPPVTV